MLEVANAANFTSTDLELAWPVEYHAKPPANASSAAVAQSRPGGCDARSLFTGPSGPQLRRCEKNPDQATTLTATPCCNHTKTSSCALAHQPGRWSGCTEQDMRQIVFLVSAATPGYGLSAMSSRHSRSSPKSFEICTVPEIRGLTDQLHMQRACVIRKRKLATASQSSYSWQQIALQEECS
jgi:hypothetical protein